MRALATDKRIDAASDHEKARSLRLDTKTCLLISVLIFATALLYSPFLSSPLVFDDINFFSGSTPGAYADSWFHLDLRWFAYKSLGWQDLMFGSSSFLLRLGNLILHAANAVAIFVFLRRLFDSTLKQEINTNELTTTWFAFFAALVFVLHPIAVYGAGYLVQRSILMATLFSLLTWLTYMEGMLRGKQGLLVASAGFYFLAVFSKEHAVMAPGVALALSLLLCQPSRELLRRSCPVFCLFAAIAIFVLLKSKGVLGSPYEIYAQEMLRRMAGAEAIDIANAYPLSVITQSFLFFKYLFLWAVPNTVWMSVDMREPLATELFSWPHTLGLIGFIAYGLTGVWLLLKRGKQGLIGFAMLCPWILFATEFAAVRIQEPFVLYRSYLWMVGAFAVLPVIFSSVSNRVAFVSLLSISIVMAPLAWNRLTTFSDPFTLWSDAEALIRDKEQLPGIDRIYYNRGKALWDKKLRQKAINDFTKVIELNPLVAQAYHNRGAIYYEQGRFAEALAEFNKTLALDTTSAMSYLGRGYTYARLGNSEAASEDFETSCNLSLMLGCIQSNSISDH